LHELTERINEVESYKDQNIAIICLVGSRSATATKILLAKGFKARNVSGGMKAYNKLD